MINLKEIFNEAFQIGGDVWIAILIAAVIVIISFVVLSLRYKLVLNFLNEKISWFDSFNVTCLTQFMAYITPFKIGSIVIKPLLTKIISSITFKKSILASVFEQLYDVAWQLMALPLLISIIGKKYLFKSNLFYFGFIIILLAGLILIVINSRYVIETLWKIKFLVPKFMRDFSKKKNLSKGKIIGMIEKSKSYLKNKKLFIAVTTLTFIHFILSALTLEVFLIFFKYNLPYYVVLICFWSSVIIGRLSGLPLGLGARDVGLGAMLVAFGVTLIDSAKIVILVRIAITTTTALCGIFFLFYNTRKINNFRELLKKKTPNI